MERGHEIFTILTNRPLTSAVWRMELLGDTSRIVRPGQFVNIELPGRFLRRPISVCDWEPGRLTLIYKVVGDGTAQLATMTAGQQLDLLTGLGNGFDVERAGRCPVVAGGGVGVPPLYGLTKKLLAAGKRPTVLLGFNSADECFYEEEFRALGVEVRVATVDGSAGRKGFVTHLLEGLEYDSFLACGPLPMLRALCDATGDRPGQISLEERMGCGFGACMGCTCKTRSGARRVCKEGPVFDKEEIDWENR